MYHNNDVKNVYRQTKCMSGACQLDGGVMSAISNINHTPYTNPFASPYTITNTISSADTSISTPSLQCDGYKGDSMATCYCVSYIDSLLHTQGILTYLSYILGSPSPSPSLSASSSSSSRDEYGVCSDVHTTIMYAFVFKYISIIYTILADQGIYYWLTITSEHIPYATKEQHYTYTFLSLTISRYVNLACVCIVGYGMSFTITPSPYPSVGVYGDATREWYGDGGYFLFCVYMIFTILPLMWELVWYYVVMPVRRHYIISQYR
ncbi:hypothetical protein EON63_07010 [archaeon]|nr:MAG: hypothetical protein EON63_07010 [archaeon]